MSKDLSFAENRLNQLTNQLLSETSVTGDIIFLADKEVVGISGSTWRFEEVDHAVLRERNFKFMLMELLDLLITDRAREGHKDTLSGIVHLEASSPEIRWLTAEQAEQLRFTA